jgi:hypothetical protein
MAAEARTCTFNALAIEPTSATRAEQYKGAGKKIEVLFHNEQFDRPVKTFPESSMKIRRADKSAQCEIDGGIWTRNAVFLSSDESAVIAKEFSGSNEQLSIYDAKTCALKQKIDVSGGAWKLEAQQLTVGKKCSNDQIESCTQLMQFHWRANCSAKRANVVRKSGAEK